MLLILGKIMLFRVVLTVIATALLFGCNGESKESIQDNPDDRHSGECVNTKITPIRTQLLKAVDFGDGSDGEFHLGFGETFLLEEKIYNFTNVNLDPGSFLTIIDELNESDEGVTINSLGICNFLGSVDLSGYSGNLLINCNIGLTIFGGNYSSSGVVTLSGTNLFLISEGESTNIMEETISIGSIGSIDISGAEFSTSSVISLEGDLIYVPDAIVVGDGSTTITAGESLFGVELDNGATSLIMDEVRDGCE